jgi:RNA polymerase sigma-70 factor (ECF subfamily)
MSEEFLLTRAIAGNSDCFGELASRWQGKLYGFIYRHVSDAEEARDLTQTTLTKAFEKLGGLSDPAKFTGWIYKIALNECRMRLRQRRTRKQVSYDEYADSGLVETEKRTPETSLESRELVEVLKESFEELSEEQRTVIIMKEYQDLKFHEIAEILEMPLSTVKSRMYLGLKTLRKLMESKV